MTALDFLQVPSPLSAQLHLCTECCAVEMVDDKELARDALFGLEEEKLRNAALIMLYGAEHDVHLQKLVLGLRNTAALTTAVRDFVSERQAGV